MCLNWINVRLYIFVHVAVYVSVHIYRCIYGYEYIQYLNKVCGYILEKELEKGR